jgi:hypothetical protein
MSFDRIINNPILRKIVVRLNSNQNKRVARTTRLLLWGIALLVLAYLVLLIPGPGFSVSRAAGRQPFLWKQNAFWSELEKEFNQARTQGCQNLLSRIDTDLASTQSLLEECSAKSLPPQDPLFADMESRLFRLAPLLAACPERLTNYIMLVTRTRAELKIQSRHWDLNDAPSRQRLYRLLFGTRMALEEVMLQAPAGSGIPWTMIAGDAGSQTPSVEFLGIKLHSGDILLSRGGAPTSALIARGNDFPGCFSHVALLHVDEKTGQGCVIESHIERGVAVASLNEYIADKKLRILVLRLRAELPELLANPMLPHNAAAAAVVNAKQTHIPYDFAMDYHDHRAQFCSEVVSAAYEPAGLRLWKGTSFISSPSVAGWLGSVGVKYFETQEPADLEYDSQLTIVAEWRDFDTLFKAHVDDAVTDVMLEEAVPGKGLPYQAFMLPVTRLLKAYSLALNVMGKVGPIPEGMTATSALRVEKFRKDHAARVTRVLQNAEEFKNTKGYIPPFWELITMARKTREP